MLTYPKGVSSSVVTPQHFGAVADGATDDTTGMLAFYTHCIDNGVSGMIPQGDYLITAGVLDFVCGGSDQGLPFFKTEGVVRFLRADATDAALLSFTSSVGSARWYGGGHGKITFEQNGKATASSQHGLVLTGVEYATFEGISGNYLGGSVLYIPDQRTGTGAGSDPDPWHVYACTFDLVEGNYCKGKVVDNQNWVGFTGCTLHTIRAIQCEGGVFYGAGAGNVIGIISAGSCKGWAIDDGVTDVSGDGYHPSLSRFVLTAAEIDDCENGIRLNKIASVTLGDIRFVHRWDFSYLNTANVYWPRVAIDIGGGTFPSISTIKISCIHRIEDGGPQGDMGVFLDCNNVAHANVDVEQYLINNTSGGDIHTYVDSDLYDNVNPNMSGVLTSRGKIIYDLAVKAACLVRSSTANSIPTHGTPTLSSTNVLTFATELYDKGGNYDSGTYKFTVPYTGIYHVFGRVCFPSAVGTVVKLGFFNDSSCVLEKIDYSQNVGNQTYTIEGTLTLTAGTTLFLCGVQNTGGAINFTTPTSASANLTWGCHAL